MADSGLFSATLNPPPMARQNSPQTFAQNFAAAKNSYLPLRRSILLAGVRLWVMVAAHKANLAITSGNNIQATEKQDMKILVTGSGG
ncbi:MAG TPA: hypothetical protein VHM27_00775, partial [Rhizomicrobium sp.]|nr:hypothetical protein [Rhizomicrobium sp.]